MNEEKQITKLTLECGNYQVCWEVPYNDATIDELCQAFYSLCVGITYLPQTVINGMKIFVEDNSFEEE